MAAPRRLTLGWRCTKANVADALCTRGHIPGVTHQSRLTVQVSTSCVRWAPAPWPATRQGRPQLGGCDYLMRTPVMDRAITRRWISEVPSKIV